MRSEVLLRIVADTLAEPSEYLYHFYSQLNTAIVESANTTL